MVRLPLIVAAVMLGVAIVRVPAPVEAQPTPFSIVEASIADLRDALAKGRVTSRDIVAQSLARIGLYEDRLHAALYVNPRALEEADDRDRERVLPERSAELDRLRKGGVELARFTQPSRKCEFR